MNFPLEDFDLYDYFYNLVRQIPEGMITTYGDMARALGDIVASRAVGIMLNRNIYPVKIPCHRVVMGNGDIGGYLSGIYRKIELLESEGVFVKNNKIVDFEKKLFSSFNTSFPLKLYKSKLMSVGLEAIENISEYNVKNIRRLYKYIAGIGMAYKGRKATATMVIYNINNNSIEDFFQQDGYELFPYIPGYESFREFSIMKSLIEKVISNGSFPENSVLMVDGAGVLQPLNAGPATYLGHETGISAIGVSTSFFNRLENKSIRTERGLKEIYPVNGDWYENSIRAGVFFPIGYEYTLSSVGKNLKPLYISSGYGISSNQSLGLTAKTRHYIMPEPVRKAAIISRNYFMKN